MPKDYKEVLVNILFFGVDFIQFYVGTKNSVFRLTDKLKII